MEQTEIIAALFSCIDASDSEGFYTFFTELDKLKKKWEDVSGKNVVFSAKNSRGLTLLHAAVAKNAVPIVRFLLSRGFPLDVLDSSGKLPELIADERNFQEIGVLLRAERYWRSVASEFNLNRMVELIQETIPAITPGRGCEKVLLIGATGSGKSTLVNYLLGGRYRTGRTQGGRFYAQIVDGQELAKVGHKLSSQTLYPQILGKKDLEFVYCDLAGLFDSRGKEERIIAASSMQMISRLAGNIRSLLVFLDINGLNSMRGAAFKETALALSKIIAKNPDLLFKSVHFIITKTDGPLTFQSLIDDFIADVTNGLEYLPPIGGSWILKAPLSLLSLLNGLQRITNILLSLTSLVSGIIYGLYITFFDTHLANINDSLNKLFNTDTKFSSSIALLLNIIGYFIKILLLTTFKLLTFIEVAADVFFKISQSLLSTFIKLIVASISMSQKIYNFLFGLKQIGPITAQGIIDDFVMGLIDTLQEPADEGEEALKQLLINMQYDSGRILIPDIRDNGESRKQILATLRSLKPFDSTLLDFTSHDVVQTSFNDALIKIANRFIAQRKRLNVEIPAAIQNEQRIGLEIQKIIDDKNTVISGFWEKINEFITQESIIHNNLVQLKKQSYSAQQSQQIADMEAVLIANKNFRNELSEKIRKDQTEVTDLIKQKEVPANRENELKKEIANIHLDLEYSEKLYASICTAVSYLDLSNSVFNQLRDEFKQQYNKICGISKNDETAGCQFSSVSRISILGLNAALIPTVLTRFLITTKFDDPRFQNFLPELDSGQWTAIDDPVQERQIGWQLINSEKDSIYRCTKNITWFKAAFSRVNITWKITGSPTIDQNKINQIFHQTISSIERLLPCSINQELLERILTDPSFSFRLVLSDLEFDLTGKTNIEGSYYPLAHCIELSISRLYTDYQLLSVLSNELHHASVQIANRKFHLNLDQPMPIRSNAIPIVYPFSGTTWGMINERNYLTLKMAIQDADRRISYLQHLLSKIRSGDELSKAEYTQLLDYQLKMSSYQKKQYYYQLPLSDFLFLSNSENLFIKKDNLLILQTEEADYLIDKFELYDQKIGYFCSFLIKDSWSTLEAFVKDYQFMQQAVAQQYSQALHNQAIYLTELSSFIEEYSDEVKTLFFVEWCDYFDSYFKISKRCRTEYQRVQIDSIVDLEIIGREAASNITHRLSLLGPNLAFSANSFSPKNLLPRIQAAQANTSSEESSFPRIYGLLENKILSDSMLWFHQQWADYFSPSKSMVASTSLPAPKLPWKMATLQTNTQESPCFYLEGGTNIVADYGLDSAGDWHRLDQHGVESTNQFLLRRCEAPKPWLTAERLNGLSRGFQSAGIGMLFGAVTKSVEMTALGLGVSPRWAQHLTWGVNLVVMAYSITQGSNIFSVLMPLVVSKSVRSGTQHLGASPTISTALGLLASMSMSYWQSDSSFFLLTWAMGHIGYNLGEKLVSTVSKQLGHCRQYDLFASRRVKSITTAQDERGISRYLMLSVATPH